MKKIAFHWQILIGMVIGVAWGLLAVKTGLIEFTTFYIKPWGTIFINLLKLIAVPLVLVSLISGITNLKDVSKLSRMGLRTILLYILTTVIAISIGLTVVNITNPGKIFPEDKVIEFKQKYAENVRQKEAAARSAETRALHLQLLWARVRQAQRVAEASPCSHRSDTSPALH